MRPPLTCSRTFASATPRPRVAVLYQALKPPIINGMRKPKKPGGYRDSGADIAYVLREQCRIPVATPAQNPNPTKDADWVFPDNEQGIVAAVKAGATCLWVNTILFKDHPLQKSSALIPYQNRLRVVGQPPLLVDAYDEKDYVNSMLSLRPGFTFSKSIAVKEQDDIRPYLPHDLEGQDDPRDDPYVFDWPVVAKPVRGRGSHGVKLCSSLRELQDHADRLLSESPYIMIEEYLSGQEATVTVMPPSAERPNCWAMPVVGRFNHVDGIAPYNGVFAVTANSRVISPEEASEGPTYDRLARECEAAARLLQTKAPIRIDARRFKDEKGSPFALFDVNMKPNMTGPGRLAGRTRQVLQPWLQPVSVGTILNF